MSEIDKLINQAFPDELRDVEPINVDEDAILSMTLEQLGLKSSPKLEIPELPVKPVRRLWPGQEKKGEPEFVEVPVVVHHRWMDWAGWAIAACLVLVCAVNWGPWLIRNLNFGIGPRSSGDLTSDSPENGGGVSSVTSSYSLTKDNNYDVSVSLSEVTYGDDTATITLSFEPIAGRAEDLDLDKFNIQLEGISTEEVIRISRSNTERQVVLKYDLDGARDLVMTVSQQVPLKDDSGEEVGFDYQKIEKLSINLDNGTASSMVSSKRYDFAPYGTVTAPAARE